MSTKLIVNIVLGAILVLALFLGYTFFIKTPASESGNGVTAAGLLGTRDPATDQSREFIAILKEIENIRFDTSIFSDTAYQSLVDESAPLPTKTPGRTNPFAPFAPTAASRTTGAAAGATILPFSVPPRSR